MALQTDLEINILIFQLVKIFKPGILTILELDLAKMGQGFINYAG